MLSRHDSDLPKRGGKPSILVKALGNQMMWPRHTPPLGGVFQGRPHAEQPAEEVQIFLSAVDGGGDVVETVDDRGHGGLRWFTDAATLPNNRREALSPRRQIMRHA